MVRSKTRGRCPLHPRQGTSPLDPSDGFARKGALLGPMRGHGRAPFLAKPPRVPRAVPLAGVQGAAPIGLASHHHEPNPTDKGRRTA